MGQNAIKTTRQGYDVFTADEKYFTIDSTKNQLKEYLSGSGTVNLTRTGGIGNVKEIVEIEHNLGYQPLFHGWYKSADDDVWYKIPDAIAIGSEGFFGAIGRPSDNILQLCFYTVEIFTPDYDEDFDYKYIIYIDPYNDAWS